jgi:hypothetical protein
MRSGMRKMAVTIAPVSLGKRSMCEESVVGVFRKRKRKDSGGFDTPSCPPRVRGAWKLTPIL